MLDVLAGLGAATGRPLWGPVLMWTVLAAPLWTALRWTDRLLHPHAAYRLSQVLLAALPAGLLVGGDPAALDVGGAASPSASSVSWHWGHTVGLATAGAILVALGALVQFGLDIWAAVRVRAAAARKPALRSTVRRLADALGLRRRPRIGVSPDAAVPLTLPGRPPVILLPDTVAERDEALRIALAHELVHLRRYDDVALLLERVVAAVFAVHPLVWGLRRSINRFRERACDAAVLQEEYATSGGYARLLVHFATGAAPYAGALSLSDSSSLIDRLRAMRSLPSLPSLSSTTLTAGVVAAGVALVFGVAACSDSLTNPSAEDDARAPTSAQTQSDDEVYVVVEESPKLKGGMKALQREVEYPERAREAGIEGRVFVQFVIGKDGSVQDPKITRGEHKLLNEAALRAVKKMEFEPGRQRGEPVRVKMSLPVTFRLPDSAEADANSGATSDASSSSSSGETSVEAGLDAIRQQDNVTPLSRDTRKALHSKIYYPEVAQKAGMQGRVMVAFTVDETGHATGLQITNERYGHLNPAPTPLAKAAKEVVRSVTFTSEAAGANLAGEELGVQFQFRNPDG